jgi:hypothetical protein
MVTYSLAVGLPLCWPLLHMPSCADRLHSAFTRLQELLRSLRPDQLSARASDEAWSAEELFEHVRASEAIIAPRIVQLLVNGPGLSWPSFGERRWATIMGRAQLPLEDRLALFELRRRELVALLRDLTAEEWSLRGDHPQLGRLSVADLCERMAGHEEEHCRQLAEIVRAVHR